MSDLRPAPHMHLAWGLDPARTGLEGHCGHTPTSQASEGPSQGPGRATKDGPEGLSPLPFPCWPTWASPAMRSRWGAVQPEAWVPQVRPWPSVHVRPPFAAQGIGARWTTGAFPLSLWSQKCTWGVTAGRTALPKGTPGALLRPGGHPVFGWLQTAPPRLLSALPQSP